MRRRLGTNGKEKATTPVMPWAVWKMKRQGLLLVVLALVLALLPTGLAYGQAPLRGTTDHAFNGGAVRLVDGVPHLRAWVGTINIAGYGDPDGNDGDIVWWINLDTWTAFPEPTNPAQASHYSMIVEIWTDYNLDDDANDPANLLLATAEHGTTTMANTTWRANGEVTFAAEDSVFDGWYGRRVHESGVFQTIDGFPVGGTSIFRLN